MTFVGRAAELSALGTLIPEERLVVITGPAGIGKTRLVGRWREGAEQRVWNGDSFYCVLADATTLDEVCASVAQAAGATIGAGGEPEELLGTILAARGPSLLILDGLDGRIPAVGAAVARWIGAAQKIHVVVTCRDVLGIPGEVVVRLGPLSTAKPGAGGSAASEAARLYAERVRELGAPDALEGVPAAAVAALMQRLGGVPLAIELAASLSRRVRARELCARLDGRLAGGGADELSRMVEESCANLDPVRVHALAQCAIFRGGFDVRAAESVLDLSGEQPPPRAVDVLQELRDRSLVQALLAGPGCRVRLSLHTAIRAWAEARVDELEVRDVLQARHAAHYLRLAERAVGRLQERSDDRAALDCLSDERENLLAAHRRGLARPAERSGWALQAATLLNPLLHAQGPWALRESLLERALAAAPPDADPLLRAAALHCRGLASVYRGRATEALTDLAEAAELARAHGDRLLEGRALSTAGMTLAQRLLRPTEAVAMLQRAVAILSKAGAPGQEGVARSRLGWARYLQGRTSEAVSAMDRAIGIFQRVGDRRREALVLVDRAIVAHEHGRLEEARLSYEQALAIQRAMGEQVEQVRVVGFLGLVAAEQGRHAAAELLLDQAVSLASRLGHLWAEATWTGYRGLTRELAGDGAGARRAYDAALHHHRSLGNTRQTGVVLALRGGLDASEGRIDVARDAIGEATALLDGHGEPVLGRLPLLCRARLELAEARAAERSGDRAGAEEHRAAAQQCLTDGTSRGELSQSIEMRVAVVLCARDPKSVQPNGATVLEVAETGRWFRPPGGEVVRLNRTRAPRRVLARLARLRVDAPGTAATLSDVLEAGWPGQDGAGSREQRVYGALWALRRYGLGPFLTSRDDGVLIDPSVEVSIAPDAEASRSSRP